MVVEDFVVEPDQAARQRYAPMFDAYIATHEALAPLMHRMARN